MKEKELYKDIYDDFKLKKTSGLPGLYLWSPWFIPLVSLVYTSGLPGLYKDISTLHINR